MLCRTVEQRSLFGLVNYCCCYSYWLNALLHTFFDTLVVCRQTSSKWFSITVCQHWGRFCLAFWTSADFSVRARYYSCIKCLFFTHYLYIFIVRLFCLLYSLCMVAFATPLAIFGLVDFICSTKINIQLNLKHSRRSFNLYVGLINNFTSKLLYFIWVKIPIISFLSVIIHWKWINIFVSLFVVEFRVFYSCFVFIFVHTFFLLIYLLKVFMQW